MKGGNGEWEMENGPGTHRDASRAHFPFPNQCYQPGAMLKPQTHSFVRLGRWNGFAM